MGALDVYLSTIILFKISTERLGSNSRQGLRIFLYATASRPAQGPTRPPIQWLSGVLSPKVKWPVCKADHSPLSSAEVKNAWSYISSPQYVFME
jgi:hypothetical protein